MPLYGQHVTPRQAMTHLTFSQIELSWTGGGGAGVNTRTSSLHGALFRGEIVAIYVLPGHHISILFTQFQKYKFSKFTATIAKHLKLMTEL